MNRDLRQTLKSQAVEAGGFFDAFLTRFHCDVPFRGSIFWGALASAPSCAKSCALDLEPLFTIEGSHGIAVGCRALSHAVLWLNSTRSLPCREVRHHFPLPTMVPYAAYDMLRRLCFYRTRPSVGLCYFLATYLSVFRCNRGLPVDVEFGSCSCLPFLDDERYDEHCRTISCRSHNLPDTARRLVR